MGYTVNRLCYFFIAAAVCFIPGHGFICAQTYIPQLPANTQVTQTITIKNVSNDPQPADDEADYADEEMTDEEFEITKKRLEESRLAYAHIFTFSPRPMTSAYGMKDVPDARKRKSRADELRLVAAALKRKFAESLVGGRRKFLLENMVNGAYFAHTDNYVAAMVPFGAPGKKNALVDARIDGVDSSGYLVCSDAREIY